MQRVVLQDWVGGLGKGNHLPWRLFVLCKLLILLAYFGYQRR